MATAWHSKGAGSEDVSAREFSMAFNSSSHRAASQTIRAGPGKSWGEGEGRPG